MSRKKHEKLIIFIKNGKFIYFFYNAKYVCLICWTTKKGNLENHFSTMNTKFYIDFLPKTEVRKIQLENLRLN